MAKSTCSVDGCERPVNSRGWCKLHYERWRRQQVVPKPCVIDGCERPQSAKGWCSAHYSRWKRHGAPEAPLTRQHQGQCEAPGCDLPAKTGQLCGTHNSMKRRTGRVDLPRRWVQAPLGGSCWECGSLDLMPGSRRFCSARCQVLNWRRKREVVLDSIQCVDCGATYSIATESGKRKRRSDMHRCETCRRRKTFRVFGRTTHVSVGELRRRLGNVCGICGMSVDYNLRSPHPGAPSVDHIIPLSRGGDPDWTNAQLSHLRCNHLKHNTMP